MSRPIWQFTITKDMTRHLNSSGELSLFLSALEDSIEQICETYKVEPWEIERDTNA